MIQPIISFDIDMTLLDHTTWEVPKSALYAIEQLRKHYKIVLSTGRDMDARINNPLKQLIDPDAMIHLNGSKITVKEQTLFEHTFNQDLLERILTFAQKKSYSLGASINEIDYYTNSHVISNHDINRWGSSLRTFKNPLLLLTKKVHTLAFIGNENEAKEIMDVFPELNLYLFSQKNGADIVEKTVSKALSLQRLCDYFGCSIKDCIAFGDSMNDYDILQTAGLGIAMGNAMEELKKVADYITTTVHEDGIYHACCHFHLIKPYLTNN